ncbi:MAG TPA: ATP-grasp domain-containing protein [Gemmatimonadales bacterium]|nr:ATP-grasp domain-containing protein [Gemmatimonadales bacterium]
MATRHMRILITDGNERASLAAARSLVQAGHSVSVCAPMRLSLAGASRRVRSHRVVTDPLRDPAGYVAELGRFLRHGSSTVLLPMTDPSVEAVLEHRDDLPAGVEIPLPDLTTYRAASDKANVMALAEQSGFAVPDTRVIISTRHAIPETPFFPAFVKPHRSVVSVNGTRLKLGVTPVADAAACRRVLEALPAAAFPVLLQRRVSGAGEGFFALRWGGRMVAMFAHRRLREKPPAGGVSVYRESILLDASLAGPGARLLEALDWNGVAMVECKRDRDTNRQVIMEVNGRFWGSLQLAIDAGVDFPELLVRCAAGETVFGPREYRVGVRSRWFWGDVDQLYLRLRNGGGGSRLQALREFLRGAAGDRGEVLRWHDPAPFVVETLQWFGLIRRTGGAK